MQASESKYKKLPKWAKKPLDNCLDYLENLLLMVDVSSKSIHVVRMHKSLLDLVTTHWFIPNMQTTSKRDLKMLKELKTITEQTEEIAKNSKRKDIKDLLLLKGMAIVLTWGALETFVIDFLKAWLNNAPDAWKADEIVNLKIRLGEFMQIDKELRCDYVVDQLDKLVNGPPRQGIGRFESLLKIFNLYGSIDDDIKDRLYEMSKIRNAFVHNKGIADKKFVDSCPSLKCKIGDQVINKNTDILRYVDSVLVYLAEIQLRIFERLGVPREELKGSPAMNIRYGKYEEAKKQRINLPEKK